MWEGILSLLACHKLESVTLYIEELAQTINDAQVEQMAQAWPALQKLVLLNEEEAAGDPLVTLQGLACLAQHCPSLKTLSIYVDATRLQEEEPILKTGRDVDHLDLLFMVEDEQEDRAADYIAKMWPNLRTRTTFLWNGAGGEEEEAEAEQREQWERLWAKVDGRLGRKSAVALRYLCEFYLTSVFITPLTLLIPL